jgi:hypothetical protein
MVQNMMKLQLIQVGYPTIVRQIIASVFTADTLFAEYTPISILENTEAYDFMRNTTSKEKWEWIELKKCYREFEESGYSSYFVHSQTITCLLVISAIVVALIVAVVYVR